MGQGPPGGMRGFHDTDDELQARIGIPAVLQGKEMQRLVMITAISRRSDELAKWAAVMFGFALPLSTALDGLFLALTVLLWLLGGRFREKYDLIRSNPVALAALAMCGVYLLGLLYGQADKSGLSDIKTFLLIPLMITLFQEERIRRYAWWGFQSSMLLTLALSYLIFLRVLPEYLGTKVGPIRPGTVQMTSIAQNLFMAYTAFVLAAKARFADQLRRRALFAALSVLAAVNVLFVVPSKTGQLVLLLLIGYYLVDWLRWKGVVVAAAVMVLVAGVIYGMPTSAVHVRLSELIREYEQWRPDLPASTASATGLRMEFYQQSLKIMGENPLFGVGAGDFHSAYKEMVGTSPRVVTDNPHNQYLLTGVELGLVGLAVLGALFFVQWRMAGRLPRGEERMLAFALLLAILSGCLFNSFLTDHSEGLFYMWTTALLYAGFSRQPNAEQRS